MRYSVADVTVAFWVLSLSLYTATAWRAEAQPRVQAKVSCKQIEHALASGLYGDAVINHIWPPAFGTSQGISIAVEFTPEIKVFLHTDGNKSTVWTSTVRVPGNNTWGFLNNLADSCVLPPDPADAVKLLNVAWETKEVPQAQFGEVHADFMAALLEYISAVQERSDHFLRTKRQGGGVDASNYPVVYDNSWQHFEILDWDLPLDNRTDPMIEWIHRFQRFAEREFQRPLATRRRP